MRLITPAAHVSAWTANTLELVSIRRRVMGAGVIVDTNRTVLRLTSQGAVAGCVFTGAEQDVPADAVLLVTARLPDDRLRDQLGSAQARAQDDCPSSITVIGDALAPSTIAAAVWSGRRYAEELDDPAPGGRATFRREVTALDLA